MNNLSTAARAGRLAGTAYRETARVVRLIDWAEVGTIVLHGLVTLVILTYVVGLETGRWTHRTNDRLAALWVRLWVGTPSELLTDAKLGVETVEPAPEVLAVQPCDPIPAALVTVELARAMLAEGMSQRAVSRELQIPRTTLRRMLAAAN